jgi:hypothetical protein
VTGELNRVAIDSWIDWYDGPIAGVATYDGRRYWIEGAGPDDDEPALDSRERRLYLYPLTDEEAANEERWAASIQQRGTPIESLTRHARRTHRVSQSAGSCTAEATAPLGERALA